MDYYQYRITLNGDQFPVSNTYPCERWSTIAAYIDERGGKATLEERLVTDITILPLLYDATGYIHLQRGKVASPWKILAEVETR